MVQPVCFRRANSTLCDGEGQTGHYLSIPDMKTTAIAIRDRQPQQKNLCHPSNERPEPKHKIPFGYAQDDKTVGDPGAAAQTKIVREMAYCGLLPLCSG